MQTSEIKYRILSISKVVFAMIVFNLAFTSCQDQSKTNEQNVLKEIIQKKMKEKDKGIAIVLDELDSFGMGDPDSGKKDSLKTAIELVEIYEWEKARSALNEYVEKYGEEDIAKYFIGYCLMNLNEPVKASRHFLPLALQEDFKLYDDANLNLGLCYHSFDSKNGLELAQKQFKKIANDPNSNYRKFAKSALEQWMH